MNFQTLLFQYKCYKKKNPLSVASWKYKNTSYKQKRTDIQLRNTIPLNGGLPVINKYKIKMHWPTIPLNGGLPITNTK